MQHVKDRMKTWIAIAFWSAYFLVFYSPVAGAVDGCGPIKGYDEDGGVLNCLPTPTPDHGSGLPVTGGIDWQVVVMVLVFAVASVLIVQAVRNRSR